MADHTGFIVAAYAITAVAFAGMVAAVLLDYRAQRRQLARLERRVKPGGPDDAAG